MISFIADWRFLCFDSAINRLSMKQMECIWRLKVQGVKSPPSAPYGHDFNHTEGASWVQSSPQCWENRIVAALWSTVGIVAFFKPISVLNISSHADMIPSRQDMFW